MKVFFNFKELNLMYLVVILFRKISKLLHSAHFLKKIGIASSTYAPNGYGVNLSFEI